MPSILRFEANVPVEVVLQNESGITVAGRYSDRVMYTLHDDRRMYVAPFVAKRISELGIRAGEPFKICKRYVKNGRSKTVDWLVERLGADGEAQLERDLQASIDWSTSRNENSAPEPTPTSDPPKPVTAPPRRVTKASDLPAKVRTAVNGSANDHSTSPPEPDDRKQSPPDTHLTNALKTAIAAAVEAEKFAKTLDYNIRFTTDDVRSMGITILIGMQQRLRN
jgi:hypothetical protein